jgi:hypothetical protein
MSEDYGLKSMAGNVTGHVSGTNATFGIGNADPGMYAATPNGTMPPGNLTGDYGIYAPELNRSLTTAPDVSNAIPQPAGASSGASHGLIPPDLLNHYGLWFFIGCVLIIGIMIAYELYRGRQKR